MSFVNMGYGNIINSDKIVAMVSYDSAPAKRLLQNSKECGKVIDATQGRRTRALIITDTGYVHNSLYERICNSDCYVLEFNHDPQVLMASDRSLNLKRRILSDHGHLSNEDAFVTLSRIMGENTKFVFYAHISQECNLVEIIELTRKKVMSSLGVNDEAIKYIVTSPISTEVYEIWK